MGGRKSHTAMGMAKNATWAAEKMNHPPTQEG